MRCKPSLTLSNTFELFAGSYSLECSAGIQIAPVIPKNDESSSGIPLLEGEAIPCLRLGFCPVRTNPKSDQREALTFHRWRSGSKAEGCGEDQVSHVRLSQESADAAS